MGVNALQRAGEEQLRNQEAESSYVRRHVWGSEESAKPREEDGMGHTVLGDITTPAPVVIAGGGSGSAWPLIAAIAASALIPTAGMAGVAGYLLSQRNVEKVSPPDYEDTNSQLGLGRIEDYLSE